MKNVLMPIGVGTAVLLSVIAITVSLMNRVPPQFNLPDDADVLSISVTLYPNTGIPTFEDEPPTKDDFVVPAEYIPQIMHILRPPAATEDRYFDDPPMCMLTIQTMAGFPILKIKCYFTGQDPVAFTKDDKNYYIGNFWCSSSGGYRLRKVIQAAYVKLQENESSAVPTEK